MVIETASFVRSIILSWKWALETVKCVSFYSVTIESGSVFLAALEKKKIE